MVAWKQSKMLMVNSVLKTHVLNYLIKVAPLIRFTDVFPDGLGH